MAEALGRLPDDEAAAVHARWAAGAPRRQVRGRRRTWASSRWPTCATRRASSSTSCARAAAAPSPSARRPLRSVGLGRAWGRGRRGPRHDGRSPARHVRLPVADGDGARCGQSVGCHRVGASAGGATSDVRRRRGGGDAVASSPPSSIRRLRASPAASRLSCGRRRGTSSNNKFGEKSRETHGDFSRDTDPDTEVKVCCLRPEPCTAPAATSARTHNLRKVNTAAHGPEDAVVPPDAQKFPPLHPTAHLPLFFARARAPRPRRRPPHSSRAQKSTTARDPPPFAPNR